MKALGAMNFPLSIDFIVPHKFVYAVSSFSLYSIRSLMSFFIPSLIKLLLSGELFSLYEYVRFLLFLLLLKSALSLW